MHFLSRDRKGAGWVHFPSRQVGGLFPSATIHPDLHPGLGIHTPDLPPGLRIHTPGFAPACLPTGTLSRRHHKSKDHVNGYVLLFPFS